MPFTQVIYASSATQVFSKDELTELLKTSRANNRELGVTGILLFKDGNFLQVLEGEDAVLDPLLKKIGNDPRHTGLVVYPRKAIDEREFPNWSMAFRDLNDPELATLPGFSEFLNTSFLDTSLLNNSPRVKHLISVFASSIR